MGDEPTRRWWLFEVRSTQEFCRNNNLRMIARAHQQGNVSENTGIVGKRNFTKSSGSSATVPKTSMQPSQEKSKKATLI
jgi:hypothetical protein